MQPHLARAYRLLLPVVCWLLGLIQIVAYRHAMNPDGISYLNVGAAFYRLAWREAIVGYWSPLYSFLLGSSVHWLSPSPQYDFFAAKVGNWLLYGLVIVAFDRFLRTLLAAQEDETSPDPRWQAIPSHWWIPFFYLAFATITLYSIGVERLNPDLFNTFFLFSIASLLIQISRSGYNQHRAIALGVLLGVSFLVRFTMLYSGLLFLLGAFLLEPRQRTGVRYTLLAGSLFLLLVAAYAIPLSIKVGHLTLGDKGTLAYAWLVNEVEWPNHWQGGPARSGQPLHPTHQLTTNPPIFEFDNGSSVTYPPSHDPGYWYEGVQIYLDIPQLVRHLWTETVPYYWRLIRPTPGSLLDIPTQALWSSLFLVLSIFYVRFGRAVMAQHLCRLKRYWYLLIPTAAWFTIYALVYVALRYVAAWMLVMVILTFVTLRVPPHSKLVASTLILAALLIAMPFLVQTHRIVQTATLHLTHWQTTSDHPQFQIVSELQRHDYQAGDALGTIGFAVTEHQAWAYLGHYRLIAEIPYRDDQWKSEYLQQFWEATPARRAELLDVFARTGVKGVIATTVPETVQGEGWQGLGRTGYYLFDLREPSATP